MAILLQKGQKVDITKDRPLTNLMVGLGWDTLKSGIFSRMDLDASAVLIKEDGDKSLVYFSNRKSKCKSVVHGGDNLTGKGSGDDEVIKVDLQKVPQDVKRIVFIINIFGATSRDQHFGMVENAFIRVVLPDKEEILRFNLSDDYSGKTSMTVGELYRHNGEWKFNAIGEGTMDPDVHSSVHHL